MRTIRLFLASSSELKNDRDQFRNFISVENDSLHKKGIYIEIVQWEFFLDRISENGLQAEYNNALKECEMVIFLFYSKTGKYTKSEFDTAHETFLTSKRRPSIWTYLRSDSPTTDKSLDDFKQELLKIGHFLTVYNNLDNLSLQFKRQLEIYLNAAEIKNNNPILLDEKYLVYLIDYDLDKALVEMDKFFLDKNAVYNDLSREYVSQPNNFSISAFKSKLKRFVAINIKKQR